MSITHETITFLTKSPKESINLGFSLAKTFYQASKFLLIRGELGSGKTTFLKGFGVGIGIGRIMQSPTYAVERDYEGKLLHLDFFRISPQEALSMLERAQEYDGLVAVEWSEKLKKEDLPEGRIEVVIEDTGQETSPPVGEAKPPSFASELRTGRQAERRSLRRAGEASRECKERLITLTFLDSPLPTHQEIHQWEKELLILPNIQEHERAVTKLAMKLGKSLLQRNIIVRLRTLEAASRVHDHLRFLDFPRGGRGSTSGGKRLRLDGGVWDGTLLRSRATDGQGGLASGKGENNTWKELRKKYPVRHEEACAAFLREKGFPVVAEIVRTHGVRDEPVTTEQKLLYYADKRMAETTLVSIEERFADFARRYGISPEQQKWIQQAKMIEKELFPGGAPF